MEDVTAIEAAEGEEAEEEEEEIADEQDGEEEEEDADDGFFTRLHNSVETTRERENKEDTELIAHSTPQQAKEWYSESERLFEQGRLRVRKDANYTQESWRHHIESVHKHSASIEESRVSWVAIQKYGTEVEKALERYRKFELKVNSEHSHLKQEYSTKTQELNNATNAYEGRRQEVDENTINLRETTEQFERVKEILDNHRNSMTDESGLYAIRTAIASLKEDVHQFEVQVGIKLSQLRVYQVRESFAKALKGASQGRDVLTHHPLVRQKKTRHLEN